MSNILDNLPRELIEIILDNIDYRDIPNSLLVCRFWHNTLQKKVRYIRENLNSLKYLTMSSLPLSNKKIDLCFQFIQVPSIYNLEYMSIYDSYCWKSTNDLKSYDKICVNNILETIRPNNYFSSGIIRVYLDNQYVTTLKNINVSEYLDFEMENNTILE